MTVRENRQRYRGDTMILETEFACDGGEMRVIDFMAMGSRCDAVRIIEGLDCQLARGLNLNLD